MAAVDLEGIARALLRLLIRRFGVDGARRELVARTPEALSAWLDSDGVQTLNESADGAGSGGQSELTYGQRLQVFERAQSMLDDMDSSGATRPPTGNVTYLNRSCQWAGG